VVTEADGAREAAITRAEGDKRSAILSAEGIKERQVLEAQGEADAIKAVAEAERFRQETVAEGEAAAVRSVYAAIHEGDPSNDLIAIKYLEALEGIADGNATKIFLPADMSGILGSLAGVAELFNDGGDGSTGHERGDDDGAPPTPGGAPEAMRAATLPPPDPGG
jgi:regulator of protease activity HflC (stomatin/prohibitin superfamily)